MPNISVAINHKLGKAEALKRARRLLDDVKRDNADKISGLNQEWDDDGATFRFIAAGFDITGDLTVTNREVVVTGKLPFLAGMFKGKIEKTIRDRGQKLLA